MQKRIRQKRRGRVQRSRRLCGTTMVSTTIWGIWHMLSYPKRVCSVEPRQPQPARARSGERRADCDVVPRRREAVLQRREAGRSVLSAIGRGKTVGVWWCTSWIAGPSRAVCVFALRRYMLRDVVACSHASTIR